MAKVGGLSTTMHSSFLGFAGRHQAWSAAPEVDILDQFPLLRKIYIVDSRKIVDSVLPNDSDK